AFQPGSTWEYSHATDVLGAVIEAVTGQRLGVFLEQSICGPLGMVDTGFWTPPGDRLNHRPQHIGGVAVFPCGAGLEGQRQRGQSRDKAVRV
ncbi:MAG: class A beta-lactamase-related serine hydrolase, partial [Betaproteobacteria bacterium]|nr:class A beta-lactamase-related serine hydrolase [Betaproteobacteria bacterium]